MRDDKPLGATQAVNEAQRCLQCVEAFCTQACPANVDARGFIQALSTGNFSGAIRKLKDENVLPLSCALVCPVERLCEGACCSSKLSYPIMIAKLQRFVAEQDLDEGLYRPKRAEPNGTRVAVVGSGPAGLGAAAELALAGYDVTLFEKAELAGGLLTGGIPPYRLPGQMAKREVDYIAGLGVTFKLNSGVDDVEALLAEGFKGVVLAVGLWDPARTRIPGEDQPGVLLALDMLSQVARAAQYDVPVGKRVLVIGGGSVAMDAAGSARRCGAEVVEVLCLEAPNEMPACREEINWGWDEGCIFHYRAMPLEVLSNGDGVTGLKAVRIQWKEPELYVPSNAVAIDGTEFVVKADTVIVAIGQRPDASAEKLAQSLQQQHGRVVVDAETQMTSRPGVFAAGDICAGGGMTVVGSVKEGQRAARGLDAYLRSP